MSTDKETEEELAMGVKLYWDFIPWSFPTLYHSYNSTKVFLWEQFSTWPYELQNQVLKLGK